MDVLRGILRGGAGSPLCNDFTEFGLAQISVDFVLGSAGTNVPVTLVDLGTDGRARAFVPGAGVGQADETVRGLCPCEAALGPARSGSRVSSLGTVRRESGSCTFCTAMHGLPWH